MQLWQDGLVALLASIGLASIMWTVVRAVLYAGPERRKGVVALLPAKDGGEGLEEQVRTLRRSCWPGRTGGCPCAARTRWRSIWRGRTERNSLADRRTVQGRALPARFFDTRPYTGFSVPRVLRILDTILHFF